MPELPEVETTCAGIRPHLVGKTIKRLIVRQPKLRWPIPPNASRLVQKQAIHSICRRAKYIILQCQPTTKHGTANWMIIHLGMSGVLHIINDNTPPQKHEHFDLVMSDNTILRYRDPRRFGCCLVGDGDPLQHRLLCKLAPEPLSAEFNVTYLKNALARRSMQIKVAIMQQHIVVGVGNIYASEALFMAKIHPQRPANSISKPELKKLISCIKQVLKKAIAAGGTTLRDFSQASGKPGYFQQELQVYGRAAQNCHSCGDEIVSITLGQRSSFYCPSCQN